MVSNSPAREALAELDKSLAAKPHVEGHTFSMAALRLSQLRDRITAEQREKGTDPASRRRLEHVNAVISIVLAGHFPLGAVPWAELEKARGWLAGLAEEDGAHALASAP
jgi:hypothetical protein